MALARNVSAAQAARYYDHDDYYARDDVAGLEREDDGPALSRSAWHGEGAKALGLKGPVEAQMFRALGRGELPDGSQLHKAGSGARRAGTDFEFSAPKSFSIQALVMGDERLVRAHQDAVASARRHIEALTATRVMRDGKSTLENTKKAVIAEFLHTTSRTGDPQLHSHVVALNLTQRADGAWRSIENGPMFCEQRLLYDIYLAEMAKGAQGLGYTLTRGKSGAPELSHISREQVETFSRRTQSIEAALADKGLDRSTATAAQKRAVTLSTRDAKKTYDRAALAQDWQERARAMGLDRERPMPSASRKSAPTAEANVRGGVSAEERAHAQRVVSFALDHLGEREAAFDRREVIRVALREGFGQVGFESVSANLCSRVRQRQVLVSPDGTRLTTPAAIALERRILNLESQGRGAVKRMANERMIGATIAARQLTAGQEAAVNLAATSENRVIGIHGLAGTGKTTALKTIKAMADQQGFSMIGLAPSHSAVTALRESGIESDTLQRWLSDKAATEKLSDRSVIVIDEAGLASNRHVASALKRAHVHNARVILVGDDKQYASVEAGRAFSQLKDAGMQTVTMSQMLRQRNPALATAARLSVDQPAAALAHIEVREIADSETRYAQIARDFAALVAAERAQTLVLTGTNEAKRALNERIRMELREGKALGSDAAEVATFQRRDLTQAEQKELGRYKLGDAIRFERAYRTLGVARGDVLKVTAMGNDHLVLSDSAHRAVEFRPARASGQAFTVGHIESRTLAPGDRLRFTGTDKDQGFRNGERGTIERIDRQSAQVRLDDGRQITLHRDRVHPVEYAYAATGHSAQGLGADRVLLDKDTRSRTTDHRSFYTDLTRAKATARIYTNDRAALPGAISRQSSKTAALDVVGHSMTQSTGVVIARRR